jgi:hypothetical protein
VQRSGGVQLMSHPGDGIQHPVGTKGSGFLVASPLSQKLGEIGHHPAAPSATTVLQIPALRAHRPWASTTSAQVTLGSVFLTPQTSAAFDPRTKALRPPFFIKLK